MSLEDGRIELALADAALENLQSEVTQAQAGYTTSNEKLGEALVQLQSVMPELLREVVIAYEEGAKLMVRAAQTYNHAILPALKSSRIERAGGPQQQQAGASVQAIDEKLTPAIQNILRIVDYNPHREPNPLVEAPSRTDELARQALGIQGALQAGIVGEDNPLDKVQAAAGQWREAIDDYLNRNSGGF